ncbi:MAG: hypothetical protein GXY11_04535 [Clostridiales bacterium]|nr:hypothetical protein [Clostridiales bacterium]
MFNGLKSLKKAKYLYLSLGLVAVVGLGFALGSIRTIENSASRPTPYAKEQAAATDERAVGRHAGESLSEAQNKPVITGDTLVHYEYVYELCSHIYQEDKAAGKEMVGLDAEGLAKLFPDAISTSIDSDGAHVKLSIDQVCPQHVMLRLEGGKCVIYRNVLGTDTMQAQQEFTIDTRKWDGEWTQSLEDGIIFDSVEELESFVEDMES